MWFLVLAKTTHIYPLSVLGRSDVQNQFLWTELTVWQGSTSLPIPVSRTAFLAFLCSCLFIHLQGQGWSTLKALSGPFALHFLLSLAWNLRPLSYKNMQWYLGPIQITQHNLPSHKSYLQKHFFYNQVIFAGPGD